MTNKLFVGGLPWSTDDEELANAFRSFGTVADAKVICDRETGRSRGFGFVTFDDEDVANRALLEMDGGEVGGRRITVREARERSPSGTPTFHRRRTPVPVPRDEFPRDTRVYRRAVGDEDGW